MHCYRDKAPSAALAIFATVLLLPPAYAEDGADLVKAKGCLVCHAVPPGPGPRANVGPSFPDIAHRFAGLRNAKAMLTMEVMAGSGPPSNVTMWGSPEYHWGPTKMPAGAARPEVNQAEAEAMVDYILSLK